MKLLALDLGDQWVGSAISDPLGIIARPYQTVTLAHLEEFLKKTLAQERISTVIVGHPRTMKGTHSEQTNKVEATVQTLQTLFPTITWLLWDERLSSKRAAGLKQSTKDDKQKSHSQAAAFILESYLSYKRFQESSHADQNQD